MSWYSRLRKDHPPVMASYTSSRMALIQREKRGWREAAARTLWWWTAMGWSLWRWIGGDYGWSRPIPKFHDDPRSPISDDDPCSCDHDALKFLMQHLVVVKSVPLDGELGFLPSQESGLHRSKEEELRFVLGVEILEIGRLFRLIPQLWVAQKI